MQKLEKFIYNSGGRNHPSGTGEWEIETTKSCQITVKHISGSKAEFNTAFSLDQKECIQLWKLVKKMKIDTLYFRSRPPVPDETLHTFILETHDAIYEKQILDNDVARIPGYHEFSAYIRKLVMDAIGKKPIF